MFEGQPDAPNASSFSLEKQFMICSDAFESVAASIGDSHADLQSQVADQAARFNIWATNIGIYAAGQRALSFKLQDAASVKQLLELLLLGLGKELNQLAADSKEPEPGSPHSDDGLSDTSGASYTIPYRLLSSTQEAEFIKREPEHTSSSPPNRHLEAIDSSITRLLQVSALLQRSARGHRKERISQFLGKDENQEVHETIKRYALQKVSHSYSGASETLQQRMAQSIAMRRTRFAYFQRHYQKIALKAALQPSNTVQSTTKETEKPAQQAPAPVQRSRSTVIQGPEPSVVLSATVNTKFDISKIEQVEAINEVRAESVRSTYISHSGFPREPKLSPDRTIFVCPYCCLVYPAKDGRGEAWRSHVARDFEPFFCIFDDCTKPFDSATTFRGWISHIRENHIRSQWKCWLCAQAEKQRTFSVRREFEAHMDETHSAEMNESTRSTLMMQASLPDPQMFQECPFCGGYPEDVEEKHPDIRAREAQDALQQHIKDHLISVALILQPVDGGEDGEKSVSGSSGAQGGSASVGAEESVSFQSGDHRRPCDCQDEEKDSMPNGDWTRMESIFEHRTPIPEYLRPESHNDETFMLQLERDEQEWEFWRPVSLPPICRRTAPPNDVGLEGDLKLLSLFGIHSPDSYTVAWIATRSIERAAAEAMLDEGHEAPTGFSLHQYDTNSYTWGRVGEHNIIIASNYDEPASAATTASSLLASLPSIRVVLLVGIGGGVPRPDEGRDIRLGDIVVSQPHGTTGGVCQYDLNMTESGDIRVRKSFLGRPPAVLLNALAGIQAHHERKDPKAPCFLREMLEKNPKMGKRSKQSPGFVHQGFDNDRLFKASYDHVPGPDCQGCDPASEVQRHPRDDTDPKIHYGTIAVGNRVVRNAAVRDWLVANVSEDYICFETEAAGLMNQFPCLVIRGICDYADSHKNHRWQRYASATAAAYAKELLAYLPAAEVQETKSALEVIQLVQKQIDGVQQTTTATKTATDSIRSDLDTDKIKRWLCPLDPSTNTNYAEKLFHACYAGLVALARDLIRKGADVNVDGVNALQAASLRGHQEIVKLLLDNGADVNAKGGNHGNALQAASSSGHQEIVKLLLDNGADVNAKGGSYGNALQAALLGGYQEIVKLLLDYGADVNAKGGNHGNALQAASSSGYQYAVELLLDNPANVNAKGGSYSNALQAASFAGHKEIVELLLIYGADVNAKGGSYGNALQAASSEGHQEIVDLLLDNGADVDAKGGYGNAL